MQYYHVPQTLLKSTQNNFPSSRWRLTLTECGNGRKNHHGEYYNFLERIRDLTTGLEAS